MIISKKYALYLVDAFDYTVKIRAIKNAFLKSLFTYKLFESVNDHIVEYVNYK